VLKNRFNPVFVGPNQMVRTAGFEPSEAHKLFESTCFLGKIQTFMIADDNQKVISGPTPAPSSGQ